MVDAALSAGSSSRRCFKRSANVQASAIATPSR
jgi:hypothetical protein